MFSIIITPNIHDYIQILLKLSSPAYIYRQPLDKPNLKYMVALIWKVGFKDLVFVIPSTSTISDISKTMIFVDSIDETIEMVKYLWSRLSKRIRRIRQLEVII